MTKIVILCEDQQQEVFIRRFLKKGNMAGDCRYITASRGKGAGEQFVRERYPKELSLVARNQNTSLLVMIDADTGTVEERLQQLNNECKKQDIALRQDGDPVAVFIPKHNIETWIAWLRDPQKPVDETNHSYPRLSRPRDCQPQVVELHGMCTRGQLPANAPDSLKAACKEWERLP